MKRVCQKQGGDKTRIASSLGYENKAAIASHLRTGIAMNLMEESGDSINLTERGIETCNSKKGFRESVTDFLCDSDHGLGKLTNALRQQGTAFGIDEFKECISLFVEKEGEAQSLVNNLMGWYEFAGLIRHSDGIIYSLMTQGEIAHQVERSVSREFADDRLYAYLLENEFEVTDSKNPVAYNSIRTLFDDFKQADSEDSEEIMKLFLSSALRALGFVNEFRNGPRKRQAIVFGPKGDDFLVRYYIDVDTPDAPKGVLLSCELKRSNASKKSVSQARTFSDAVGKDYPAFHVIPIVISDSDRYLDDVAARYAESSNAIHIPIEFFKRLVDFQMKRFSSGKMLILPSDVVSLILTLADKRTIEPRLVDLVSKFSEE